MKSQFKSYLFLEIIIYVLVTAAIILIGVSVGIKSETLSIAAFIGAVVSFVIAVIISQTENGGEISADDSDVSITYRFLGINVFNRRLEYSVIDYTSADVKVASYRYGVSYWLILSINTKDGKTIKLKSELHISSDMVVNEPDKYKAYLSNLSLTEISNFINEQIQGVWRA